VGHLTVPGPGCADDRALLQRYGTDEQCRTFLPPILDCSHRYCQGYSEPEAGSDLAGLRTTAVRDGDARIVNGAKIWTTLAYDVTHMFLLARTGDTGPKQAQISFFLLDLDSAGVLVRRIRDMAAEEELCEVFLDNVRIPAGNLSGGVNDGWTVAKSVLSFERIHVGSPAMPESGLALLERVARAHGVLDDPAVADRIAALTARRRSPRGGLHRVRARAGERRAVGPGRVAAQAAGHRDVPADCRPVIEVAGPAGGAAGAVHIAGDDIRVLGAYYRARPSTIYGGSSEVQRNIIAKQVLKLSTELRNG
jgi:alkylation response protein AidB-like acyl-CoA dehydrogenase